MFMRQKRNEAARLIWITSHGDSLSARITIQTAARHELTRADAFPRSREQRCEIQSVWNAWIQQRTQVEQEKHRVQRDSQKPFDSAHRYYLPWIYCSNTHCTMVLWQKMWYFHI